MTLYSHDQPSALFNLFSTFILSLAPNFKYINTVETTYCFQCDTIFVSDTRFVFSDIVLKLGSLYCA